MIIRAREARLPASYNSAGTGLPMATNWLVDNHKEMKHCCLTTLLRPRMRTVVHRHQIRQRNLGILLCRRKAGVPEQFLNGPEVRSLA